MICLTLFDYHIQQYRSALNRAGMAEIRLDTGLLSPSQLQRLFSRPIKMIATCRSGIVPDSRRADLLSQAITAGAAYVDIDPGTDKAFMKDIRQQARLRNCPVILSYHNFTATPAKEDLLAIIKSYEQSGAALIKLACLGRSPEEVARMLSLYEPGICPRGRLLSLSMGPQGTLSRIAALQFGAPFSYASPAAGAEAAAGQLTVKQMQQLCTLLLPEGR